MKEAFAMPRKNGPQNPHLDELSSRRVLKRVRARRGNHGASLLDEQMSRVLSTLSPHEERILRQRFGVQSKARLMAGDIGTVGQRFSVSKAEVYRIEKRALEKLKARQPKKPSRPKTRMVLKGTEPA
ncbi:MAG: sigma factor-like helix-turn-helix DNA-binding protein [Alphaproteobacteria bacterium]|nr:sigma factor-like helix-turn-helix DNA-binding protein [Alphaproteobacteria bacterium]